MATGSQENQPTYRDDLLYRKIIIHEDLTTDELEHLLLHDIFSFRTICKNMSWRTESITGCPCAYEHEYFDCVQNDGGIDHRMLEKICKRIANGECEHVPMCNNTINVAVTYVTALHVAIATQNSQLYEKLSEENTQKRTGKAALFGLHEFNIAVIKRNYSYMAYLKETRLISPLADLKKALFSYFQKTEKEENIQSGDNSLIVKWRFTLYPSCNCFIICAQRQDIKMLKHVLACECNYFLIYSALEYCIGEGLVNIFELLLDFVIQYPETLDEQTPVTANEVFISFTQVAVLFNRPEVLRILQQRNALSKETYDFEKLNTLDIAMLLGHKECADILKDSMSESKLIAEHLNVYSLVLHSTKLDGTLCVRLLRRLSAMGNDINKVTKTQTPPLTEAVRSPSICNLTIIQTIFDLGADVNLTESFSGHEFGNNALFTLLSQSRRGKHGREILKMILYQNPDLNRNFSDKYSIKAVQCDKGWRTNRRLCPASELIVEFSIHAIEDSRTEPDIHQFVLPFLWECGFQVSIALVEEDLHPVLNSFIREVTSQPRSLKMQCRTSLRSHFTGRNIHRFVEICLCPKPIKEYILMIKLLLEQ